MNGEICDCPVRPETQQSEVLHSATAKWVRDSKVYEEKFLRRAIKLSASALDSPGKEPFAAVVVRNGRIVGEGVNCSRQKFDPTSHGEVEAIRDACRKLRTVNLRRCDLYSSCEPCALCVATMAIAGIEHLYYAAGLEESNAVLSSVPSDRRFLGVDAKTLREECGNTVETRSMPSYQSLSDDALHIIAAWSKQRS